MKKYDLVLSVAVTWFLLTVTSIQLSVEKEMAIKARLRTVNILAKASIQLEEAILPARKQIISIDKTINAAKILVGYD